MNDTTKFVIECEMRTRWVPHFLGMLKMMQYLGNIGSSRNLTFYSDGDGDFRPKFTWDESLPKEADPLNYNQEDKKKGVPSKGYTYDAG